MVSAETDGAGLVLAGILAALSLWLAAGWWRQRRKRARVLQQLRALTQVGARKGDLPAELIRPQTKRGRWTAVVARMTPLVRNTSDLLAQSGVAWGERGLLVRSLLYGAFVPLAVALFARSFAFTLPAALAGLLLPVLYLLRKRAKRMRAFEEQLPDAIDLLGRAIRAGHSVTTGLKLVAEEAEDPVAGEFRRVFEEQKYGLPFEDTLTALTRRVDLVDLRVMVVAILVQREVGGNLAEILDKISGLIRTRFTLRRQLRVYTAQGRLSGYVLTALPVIVAVALSILQPGYADMLLQDPAGRVFLGAAGILQAIGYVWIWRIQQIAI